MPQLDYIIIFPQIFWLILVFIGSYIILSHYFLPNFLKSIKTRKEIVNFNLFNSSEIQKNRKKKQIFLNKLLSNNLILIKNFLSKESILLVSIGSNVGFNVDIKVATALYNFILYYNMNIVNCIQLKPKLTSLYFKKEN